MQANIKQHHQCMKWNGLVRKKFIYFHIFHPVLPLYAVETQQWPLVWLFPWRVTATEAYRITVQWVPLICDGTKNNFTHLFIPFCFVKRTFCHHKWLSDGRVTCLNCLQWLLHVTLLQQHEPGWCVQTFLHVCFIPLAKPDGWGSAPTTNTGTFSQSFTICHYILKYLY